MTIAKKLAAIAENEQKVFDAGKQSEYDRFWDSAQNFGNRVGYICSFAGYCWNDDTYNPKYPITATENSNYLFWNARITNTKVPIYVSTTGSNNSNTFASCSYLVTIPLLVAAEKTTFYSSFNGCTAMENITFEGTIGNAISFNNSSKLTNKSVQSIIDHLKDLTGANTQTLTLHANVGANLTDEQKASVTAKNWTLAY